MDTQKHGQEELFIDRAAHLLLALAGLKPLPKEDRQKIGMDLPVTNQSNDNH